MKRLKKTLAFAIAGIAGIAVTIGAMVLPPVKPAECKQCGTTNGFLMSDDPRMTCTTAIPHHPAWICANCGHAASTIRNMFGR